MQTYHQCVRHDGGSALSRTVGALGKKGIRYAGAGQVRCAGDGSEQASEALYQVAAQLVGVTAVRWCQ